jgi:hypothetical protein
MYHFVSKSIDNLSSGLASLVDVQARRVIIVVIVTHYRPYVLALAAGKDYPAKLTIKASCIQPTVPVAQEGRG